jgi:hypothetical protein
MDIAASKHPREIRHFYSTIRQPQAVGYLATYERLQVRLFLLHTTLDQLIPMLRHPYAG